MKKLTTTTMQRTLNEQDERLTVGLDLGDRSSFYCVLDEKMQASSQFEDGLAFSGTSEVRMVV